MFKHILVPLDGSRLAESVLPAAFLIARACQARLTLLHIIEKNAPQQVHGDRHLRTEDEACKYLSDLAEGLTDIDLITHVHTEETSDIVRSIDEHSDELSPDLIVMCSHGHGGLKRFLTGSIAHQVIGLGHTPILLIQSEWEGISDPDFSRILVALDGESLHDYSLDVAASLARALAAQLHLLTVVPTLGTLSGKQAATGRLLPGTARAILDLDEMAVRDHLAIHKSEMEKHDMAVGVHVRRGDPVQEIIKTAESLNVGILVLGTHGKAGLEAFWAGSVAPKVAGATKIPLLLVPVKQ